MSDELKFTWSPEAIAALSRFMAQGCEFGIPVDDTSSGEKIIAPWPLDVVNALNEFQERGEFHPFTCPHGHGSLKANTQGWTCYVITCRYTQNWAHMFMAERPA